VLSHLDPDFIFFPVFIVLANQIASHECLNSDDLLQLLRSLCEACVNGKYLGSTKCVVRLHI